MGIAPLDLKVSLSLSLSRSRSLSLSLSLSKILVTVHASDMRTQRVEAFGVPTALSEAEWERGAECQSPINLVK